MTADPAVGSMDRRLRLCMKDLYHADVVEMIERETRRYEIHVIESPDHPDFPRAFELLWETFGPHGEMEPEPAIRSFLKDDPFTPEPNGTFMKYYLLIAKDKDGALRGVRDGTILINPAYTPDLCAVYLAHILMLPEARGTVLSYWMRIAPVELAMEFMAELHARGHLQLPAPDQPGRYFGMRLNLTAEMEYFAPEDPISLQRILFYGRGGFDVINPRHFPYVQPDFREPALVHATGSQPVPFMILLRRMGRERQASIPIDEAAATMRLLYDDFASFCAAGDLEHSLDRVMQRLTERSARGKRHVELLPLPTGPRDLGRLRPLWRYNAYSRYYTDNTIARTYVESVREQIRRQPRWLDEQLARIAQQLSAREHYVYANRDRGFTWEGVPDPPQPEPDPDQTQEIPAALLR